MSKTLHSLRVALVAVATVVGADVSAADDPKTAKEAVKFMRYNDPAADADVYKVLQVILASTDTEVKVEGCKTGPNQTLLKAKLIDAGDTSCPNGVIPNHFILVIPGIVEKIEGQVVTVSYEVTDAAITRKTVSLPKELISKNKGIAPGAGLIIYPEIAGFKNDSEIIKDFKAFSKQMNEDPFAVWGTPKFSVQLK